MENVFLYEADKDARGIDNKLREIVNDILDQNEIEVASKTVLVKPNMLGAFDVDRGATTHPLIVEAIVAVLEERGAKEIYVGDSPGGAEKGTEGTARKCGIYTASRGHFLNFSKVATIIPIKSRFIDKISVPKILLEADIVINVPKLKTHGFMGFSACIKNMFGVVIGPYKAKLHFRAPSIEQFGELLMDIYDIRVPDINIIDGMVIMEGDGPTSGPTRKENIIIAGKNGIAVDLVIAGMMSFEVKDIRYLAAAQKRHPDQAKRDDIVVVGPEKVIDDLKRPVTYMEATQSNEVKDIKLAANGLQTFADIGRMVPKLTRPRQCKKCRICVDSCPAGAITIGDLPEINYKKCISCYCCAELCYENCYDIWDTGTKMDEMFKHFMEG